MEKVDDAFGFGREVRAFRERCRVRIADEAAHGQSAHAQRRGAEEMAPRWLHQAIVGRLRGMHGNQREVTAASLAKIVEQTRVRAAREGSEGIFGDA